MRSFHKRKSFQTEESIIEETIEITLTTEPIVEENVDRQLVIDYDGRKIQDEIVKASFDMVIADLLENIQSAERE